jgi:virginiamycin A acetyltransferase
MIHELADIEESKFGSKLIIGENSVIDAFVKIKFVGGRGDIIIGDNTYINSGCVLYSGNGIKIGNNVSISAGCFFTVNHEYRDRNKLIQHQGFMNKGGIIIEDDVWIGAGCIIMDGVHISEGCVMGANQILWRHDFHEYAVYSDGKRMGVRK